MDAKKLILTNRQKRTRFQILTAAAVFTVLALAAIALIVWGLLADYITTLVGILVIVFGVSSALLVFISVRLAEKQNRLRLIAINSLEHFPTMHFVYTESYFNAEVDRFLRRKAGKNPGYMVSFDAKNLYSTVLAAYGEDVTKEIVEVMYQCVHKQLNNRAGVFFGYDANDGFFLYFHGFTREQVINEIQALADASENALKSRPSLPIVTLLFGVYPMQFGEPSDYCIDRAVYAQRYDIASRTDSTPVFFRDQMKENAQVESYLAKEINSVLDEGQLEIYYQPKWDLKTSRFFGAEALIRWNHPKRGVLPPSVFVPYAERTGLITLIDRYVFRRVCQDIEEWTKQGKRLTKISVNLSRRSIYDPELLDYIQQTMKQYNTNPLLLEIEVTESIAARNAAFTADIVKKIKALRLDASIDDFGVGYSSFSSLKQLSFNTMKIDKSFVDDIEIDARSRDMVRCLIGLAHALDMKVIAEGVQTEKQVSILTKLDLDEVQGFYYSRPLSKYSYERFLKENAFENQEGKA